MADLIKKSSASGAASPAALETRPALTWHSADGKPLPTSKPAGDAVNGTFINSRAEPAELVWFGADGSSRSYRTLRKDESFSIRTRPGIVWLVRNANKEPLGHFVVEANSGNAARAVIP